ncbi:hypothetical protein [Ideonella sp.]|jgi:hypothetical protein|uniref:hypothetical protein n=1 Tax=Ideonella sp. TaxID=1929293 RepID=UPI0037BFF6D7
MRFREVVIFSGQRFQVPQGIQRIDHRSTHGWQLRYAGTKLFSDHTTDGSGAEKALNLAMDELQKRIRNTPPASRLQRAPSKHKRNDLPVGISGPVVRLRKGGTVRDCSLSVLLPRFGQASQRKSVYIATENTYTVEKFQQALDKAVALREKAERVYQKAELAAAKAGALDLKRQLKR